MHSSWVVTSTARIRKRSKPCQSRESRRMWKEPSSFVSLQGTKDRAMSMTDPHMPHLVRRGRLHLEAERDDPVARLQVQLPSGGGAAVPVRVHVRVGVRWTGADEGQGERGGERHPQHLLEHPDLPLRSAGRSGVARSLARVAVAVATGRGSRDLRTWRDRYRCSPSNVFVAETMMWSGPGRLWIARITRKVPSGRRCGRPSGGHGYRPTAGPARRCRGRRRGRRIGSEGVPTPHPAGR